MFRTRSSLLPVQFTDIRGRSKHGVRTYVSSKRARYAVAAVLALCIVLFLLAFTPPVSIPFTESSNRIAIDDAQIEQTEAPPIAIRPPAPAVQGDTTVWKARAEQVKQAFVRGYSAYYKLAFPHDELLPKTNGVADK